MEAQLVRTYRAHPERITALVALPDSHHIVSAAGDATCKVWHTQSDEAIDTLTGHTGPVNALVAFPNSDFIVSGGDDQRLIVWNSLSGEAVRVLEGHQAAVHALQVTPDGNHIVSGGADHTVCIWDSVTGVLKHQCHGHQSAISTLAVTADGAYVLAGEVGNSNDTDQQDHDSFINVWRISDGQLERTFTQAHKGILSLQFTLDDRLISAATEGDITFWHWQSGQAERTIETHRGSMVFALVPNQPYAIIGTQKPVLELWDLMTGTQRQKLDEPSDWVSALAFTPDGKQLIVGCHDGTLNIYQFNR